MKAVILDAATLGEDIDFSPIEALVDTLEVYPHTAEEEVAKRLREAEVAIVNKFSLSAAILETLPTLKLISVLATGTNNIDTETAHRQGIQVRNVAGYGTASVSQHTLMLMLTLAARLPLYQRDLRAGQWQHSNHFCLLDHPTLQLADKRLVLVGQGNLGRRVAKLAGALGMVASFAARPGNEAADQRPPLCALAPEADVISLHCPLTPVTRHLIDSELLARLRPGTLLVNCARGGIVDEEAALKALRDGRLGGLAVDVLPEEPPRNGHPLLDALAEPLNLVVTPHNAWITPEARQRIVALTADNLRAFRADSGHSNN